MSHINIFYQRFLLLTVCWFLATTWVWGQLSDPREKFSLSATILGYTNTDYTWKTPSGNYVADGRMKDGMSVRVLSSVKMLSKKGLSVSLEPFYHFSNQRFDTELGASALGFSLPSAHHHFGSSLSVNYQLLAWGKPLTLIGRGSGNFSQYGFENASGMMGALYTLTRNNNTYLSVGAIYLLGTAVAWPLYPMIVYSHRFNNHWSINCMEVNNYLNYHVSPTLKYSFGMEIETNRYYFRPSLTGLPHKAMVSLLSENIGFFTDWKAAKGLTFNMGLGANIPFYGRLKESGYRKSYMDMRAHVKPFVRLTVKYGIGGES